MDHYTSSSVPSHESAPEPASSAPTSWYATYGRPPGAAAPAGAEPEAATPEPAPRRRIWLPVTTAATGAALAASLLTASFTGAFSPSEPAASGSQTTTTAPVVQGASTKSVNWQQVAENVRPAVVAITAQTRGGGGEGSGVIIDGEGHIRSEEHTSELQSRGHLVCRLLLEKKK